MAAGGWHTSGKVGMNYGHKNRKRYNSELSSVSLTGWSCRVSQALD